MFLSKLKTSLVIVLALAVMGGAGAGAYYLRAQVVSPERPRPVKLPDKISPDKIEPAKSAEALQKLLKERRDWAELEMKVRYEKYRAGAQDASLELIMIASKHLLKAELELNAKKADRLVAHERHVRLMKEIAEIVEAKYEVGTVSKADYAQSKYERLNAEIAFEREKAR